MKVSIDTSKVFQENFHKHSVVKVFVCSGSSLAPDGLDDLGVVALGVAQGGAQADVPQVVGDQHDVARLLVQARACRVAQSMHPP